MAHMIWLGGLTQAHMTWDFILKFSCFKIFETQQFALSSLALNLNCVSRLIKSIHENDLNLMQLKNTLGIICM